MSDPSAYANCLKMGRQIEKIHIPVIHFLLGTGKMRKQIMHTEETESNNKS